MEPKCQAFEFYDNMDTCWLHDAFKGYLQAQGWHAGAKSVAQWLTAARTRHATATP